jgi:hypothetical protein
MNHITAHEDTTPIVTILFDRILSNKVAEPLPSHRSGLRLDYAFTCLIR